VRTADPSADGRRSAASRAAIGGKGQIVSRPRGDNLLQSERDDDVIIGLHCNDDDVYNSRAYLVRDKPLMIDMSLNVEASFSALLGRPIE